MKNIFSKSEKFLQEYCCSIVKVGDLEPVKNSNRLFTTEINGIQVVVNNSIKTGDIVIYAANETQINGDFLCCNNLYDLSCRELNNNYLELEYLVANDKNDEAKKLCGFFQKTGRVKCIRLRGIPSFGVIFKFEELYKWKPELEGRLDMFSLIGTDFDTIGEDLFVKVYIPEHKGIQESGIERGKRSIDRIVDGQFFKHYETTLLNRAIDMINPKDKVIISTKIHGTSAIYANIICNVPRLIHTRFTWFNNLVNYIHLNILPRKWQKIDKKYDLIYSKRNVVMNEYFHISLKKKQHRFSYLDQLYGKYAEILKPYIPKGMTVYGEIFGYIEKDSGELVTIGDGDYDYGCEKGKNKFMPYRIATMENGSRREWEIEEVRAWTENLIVDHPELRNSIFPIDILYSGTLKNLYPDIEINESWSSNVLERLKNEKKFYMEMNEPLCKNKVPREGVVLRKVGDPIVEAFKLKTVSFLEGEQKRVDSGNLGIEYEC